MACEYLQKYGTCPRFPIEPHAVCPKHWDDHNCAALDFPATSWRKNKKSKLRTFDAARTIDAHENRQGFSAYDPAKKKWQSQSAQTIGALLQRNKLAKWPAPDTSVSAVIIPKGSNIAYPKIPGSSEPYTQNRVGGWASFISSCVFFLVILGYPVLRVIYG